MSIEKNCSILLSTLPYRESSLLVNLYSLRYGRINALAKGVRRNNKQGVPLERGYMIDHLVYFKPYRDLHLITDCQIVDHFPGIRTNLEKTAIRDLVFDVIIASVRVADPNTHLFTILIVFLSNLDRINAGSSGLLLYGAKTLFAIAGELGFFLDFSHCAVCGKPIGETSGTSLAIQEGSIRCSDCTGAISANNRLLGSPVSCWLSQPGDCIVADVPSIAGSTRDAIELIDIAVDYCCFHLDIHRRLDSQMFIRNLFSRPGDKKNDISETIVTLYNKTVHQKEIT